MSTQALTKLKDSYYQAVLLGSADVAHQTIDHGIANGIPPFTLYAEVILAVHKQIEELLGAGGVSLPQERIASQIALRAMARLASLIKPRLKLGRRAVVVSVEGDHHVVAPQAAADFLAMDGWEVDLLGAGIPTNDLIPFVQARSAEVVCVACSLIYLLPAATSLIHELKKLDPAPKSIVLGPALTINPGQDVHGNADGYASDPQQAVVIARQACGMLQGESSLSNFLQKVGRSVHEYRKLRGLSQQELAITSDLDRAYISAVEHGKQNVSIGAISKLAKAFNISIEELLVGSEK